MVLTGVDLDQFNKTAPPRVKSAPGAIELNRHFGAETDLLNLQCVNGKRSRVMSKHDIAPFTQRIIHHLPPTVVMSQCSFKGLPFFSGSK